jgi:hypothetical protein
VFGRIGDLVGRKYTFLVTIMVMGTSTFLVGLLPTYATIGWLAPILLVTLRLCQGLALGGEYGGAATYVAEHSRPGERGFSTSWIQTTATLGLLLALIVIALCREYMLPKDFSEWGWRIPFIVSVVLLIFSIYIRLKLNETPIFQRMKEEGKGSRAPLTDLPLSEQQVRPAGAARRHRRSRGGVVHRAVLRSVLPHHHAKTLLHPGVRADRPVADHRHAVLHLWLSDRIGRLKIILAGCLIAAVTYFPLFAGLTHYVNPDLEAFAQKNPITLTADAATCKVHIFVTAFTKFSACDRAKDFITKLGLSFTTQDAPGAADKVDLVIGSAKVSGFNADAWNAAFLDAGYPNLRKDAGSGKIVAKPADTNNVNWVMTEIILVIMVIYVTMVYGPIAAFLVEMFPTKIRYTSMSLPYHIGNGWFGGMLPLLATAFVAGYGDIYFGLWYPIGVAVMTFIIGLIFLRDTRTVDIVTGSGVQTQSAGA